MAERIRDMIKMIDSFVYNGVEVFESNTGKWYLKAPTNGSQRIFKDLEKALYYIDHAEVIDSHGEAMARNPW